MMCENPTTLHGLLRYILHDILISIVMVPVVQRGLTILEENELNRLLMVQFECPRVTNPCVSLTVR